MRDQTDDELLDALVDEEYQRRISRGTIDRGKLRDLIRGDLIAHARTPGWLDAQRTRHTTTRRTSGALARNVTCDRCGHLIATPTAGAFLEHNGRTYCDATCRDADLSGAAPAKWDRAAEIERRRAAGQPIPAFLRTRADA